MKQDGEYYFQIPIVEYFYIINSKVIDIYNVYVYFIWKNVKSDF